MTNPWTTLSSKQIYDNKWINVTEFDVINPSGGKGIYGKVHFKNFALGVVALDADMHTYLVGQYRFTIDMFTWEIPEGGGLVDNDPLEAAKRELLEETGLVAAEWTLLSTTHLSNSVTDEYGLLYLARTLEQREAMPEETEQLQVLRLPFAEAYQMVEDGRITDSLTIIAFQKIQLMRLAGELP